MWYVCKDFWQKEIVSVAVDFLTLNNHLLLNSSSTLWLNVCLIQVEKYKISEAAFIVAFESGDWHTYSGVYIVNHFF